MTSETLKSCPFCGGEASKRLFYGTRYGVYCDECDARVGGLFNTEAEAIAAWNARAERTCYADEVTHRDCKYSVNRGWKERTCRIDSTLLIEGEYVPLPYYEYEMECGGGFFWDDSKPPTYCPNCGAKVVGE